jgi:hypothetical protein
MTLTLLVIAIAIICAIVVTWAKRSKSQRELERHSISVEQLQSRMVSDQEVLLFDVRQPSISWIIRSLSRARRESRLRTCLTSPLPFLEMKKVVYCTCTGDKSSRMVLRRVLAFGVYPNQVPHRGIGDLENKGLSCGTLSRILSTFGSNRGSASSVNIFAVVRTQRL